MNTSRFASAVIVSTLVLSPSVAWLTAQTDTADRVYDHRENVPGIDHFWRVDATASTGGSLRPAEQAIPELKRRGFKAVVNLAGGAAAEAEGKSVEAAGMRYFLIPLAIDTPTLDPAPIDPFLKVAGDPANYPLFIHSGLGHRAATFWMIKRVLLDKWTLEKAGAEATNIGLVDNHPMVPRLWLLAQDYLRAHGVTAIYK